jgi:hypothetical protein
MSCALPSYVETAALVMHAPANRSRSRGGSGIRDTGGREHKRSERDTHAALGPGVHAVSPAVDREVGRLKLAALGVQIDEPTEE